MTKAYRSSKPHIFKLQQKYCCKVISELKNKQKENSLSTFHNVWPNSLFHHKFHKSNIINNGRRKIKSCIVPAAYLGMGIGRNSEFHALPFLTMDVCFQQKNLLQRLGARKP